MDPVEEISATHRTSSHFHTSGDVCANSRFAVMSYTFFERFDRIRLDLSFFNKMRRGFFIEFDHAVKKFVSKFPIGMINFEEFLKNYQPFFRMMTQSTMILYDDYLDGYLFMQFFATIVFHGDHSNKPNLFKTMRQTLKCQATNPIVYSFLVFSMTEPHEISSFEYETLRGIKNNALFDFLIKRITNAKGGLRLSHNYLIMILGVWIQLIEDHYEALVDLIKEVRMMKDAEQPNTKDGNSSSKSPGMSPGTNISPITPAKFASTGQKTILNLVNGGLRATMDNGPSSQGNNPLSNRDVTPFQYEQKDKIYTSDWAAGGNDLPSPLPGGRIHKISNDQSESKGVGSNTNFDDELRLLKNPTSQMDDKPTVDLPRQLGLDQISTPGRNSVQHQRRKSDEIVAENFKLRLTLTEGSPAYRKRSNSVTIKSEAQSMTSFIQPDSTNKCGILNERSLNPECFSYREVASSNLTI